MNRERAPSDRTRSRAIHALAHSLVPRQPVPVVQIGEIVDEYQGMAAAVPVNNVNHFVDAIDIQQDQGFEYE